MEISGNLEDPDVETLSATFWVAECHPNILGNQIENSPNMSVPSSNISNHQATFSLPSV